MRRECLGEHCQIYQGNVWSVKRDPYFDVLKFCAMFLVVFGHAYWAMNCKTGMPYFENFRCGMNVPLFFMISGYFSARTITEGDWLNLGRRLCGYFWPAAVASVVFAAFAVVFKIPGSEKGLVGYAGRWFLFSPWFLWCLAICFVLTFLVCRLKGPVLRIGIGLILAIAFPCLEKVWGMHNVRAMLPHFLLGVFVLRRWPLWKDWRIGLACALIFVTGVCLQGDICVNGLSFYKGATTWKAFLSDGHALLFYVVRLMNGMVGSLGMMWLLWLLMERFSALTKLAAFGTTTLGIYVLHQWFLARIVDLGWMGSSIYQVVFCTLILFFICHLIIFAIRKPLVLRRALLGEW